MHFSFTSRRYFLYATDSTLIPISGTPQVEKMNAFLLVT